MKKLLSLVLALGLSTGVFADDHDEAPPALSDVWVFAAKPGMRGDMLDGFKAFWEARAAAGDDSREYTAYVPVIGDKMERVMVRACCFDWADQDAYVEERAKIEGLDGTFDELVMPYVDHMHHYFERTDWEHSNISDGNFEGPFYGETTWMLSEGSYPEAGEARRAISKELLEGWATEDNQWLWLTRIGGKPAISIVSSYDNWADMAPLEQSAFDYMSEKHGKEKAQEMFAAFSSGKASSSYTVWRRDDDASMKSSD